MHWALKRQLLFALAIAGFIVLATGIFYALYIYKPATCFDGKQNQDEAGIDCGGSCALLCTAPNISTVWARPVKAADGVYHAVALIRNPDTTAGGSISYDVSLFDKDNILIARRPGSMTLAPGELAPLFEPNISTGERVPARVFVDITPGMFERTERVEQPVRVVSWDLDENALRLTATVQNYSLQDVPETVVTALLFNPSDVLVNASQTRTGPLKAGEKKTVVFTWQEPFGETISRVDLVPRSVGN